jgi:hypothetical protein
LKQIQKKCEENDWALLLNYNSSGISDISVEDLVNDLPFDIKIIKI